MQDPSNEDGWQELHLPSRKECPKLFYSFRISKDSISLLLTDLISIWDCSLDKYDIFAEAARQQASIDPSESSGQFGLLLSKLRECLQDGHSTLLRDCSPASQGLLLRTNIGLPRPLKPLDWTFRLEQKNASELAEQLLRPSLHEVSVSQDKINSLLRIIKDKDHVISRLLDRIGTSAIDLSLIFPGVAGTSSRKGGQLTVADAKKHVAGMALFDENLWTKQFSNEDGYEGADRTGLKNLVTGCEKCFVHTRQQHEDWLNGLATSDKGILKNTASKNQSQSSMGRTPSAIPEPEGDESTESDDDFEVRTFIPTNIAPEANLTKRQATPPNLQSKKAESRKLSGVSSDTHDEAHTEDENPSSKKAKTAKIGRLGRRNATKAYGESKSRPKSSSSAAQPSSPGRHSSPEAAVVTQAASTTATATTTESDSELDTTGGRSGTARKKPTGNQNDPGKQKSRLGNLKKKCEERSPSSTSSEDERSEPPTSKPQPHQRTRTLEPNADSPLPAPSSPRRRLGRLNRTEEKRVQKSASSTPEAEDLDVDVSSLPHTRSSQQRQDNVPSESQTTPSRRLGRLGGCRKTEASSRTESPQPSSSTKAKLTRKSIEDTEMRDHDDTTNGNTDADPDATPTPTPSPPHSAAVQPASPSPSSKRSTQQQKQLPTSPRHTKRSSATTSPDNVAKREKEQKNLVESKEDETEQAKANRRREELKRSIASGASVRKKRRF